MSTEQDTATTGAVAELPEWNVGRIYVGDTRVPELLCRYPNDPVAVLEEIGDREVLIRYAGGRVRVRVRNPEEGGGRHQLPAAARWLRARYVPDIGLTPHSPMVERGSAPETVLTGCHPCNMRSSIPL